jgi:glycosyltransferase involved in cell wall biosynthesis
MRGTSPRVSLVVPSFNEAAVVMQESLRSVAAQSFADFECLVIDESTDQDAASACRHMCDQDVRFRYIHPATRLGLAASLNLGISMARGDLIARFDSDDVCVADRLNLQVAFMDDHPEIDVLGGGLEIIDEAGATLAFRDYPQDHSAIDRRFQTTNAVAHPTVMMRKCSVDRVGGYKPEFRHSEDLELWLRLINQGARFANLPQILVRYRQQDTRRHREHWKFNLRARLANFTTRQLPLRLLGIAIIAVWARVPDPVQRAVFRGLLLRRVRPLDHPTNP